MAKANNKCMEDEYDETKPSNYISYLDANNLYGLAMSMKLPTGKMKWGKKIPKVEEWNENDEFAYIMGVDLEYPKELHHEHSDYPLAPENMNVAQHLLSEHQRELHRIYYTGTKTPKMRNRQR